MPTTDKDPLYHSQYLLGPIETIIHSHRALASGHLSLHDVTEAYRTLSVRIRRSSCHLSAASHPFPALELLREKCADIIAALRRDISRPLCNPARHTPSDWSPTSSRHIADADGGPTIYNLNHAINLSTLCHYALRLLSEIFRFPTLSSMFTLQDLGVLLEDVLSIARRPKLPSSNPSKIEMLSSWVIRTQRLPKDVLLPRMDDIILYLELIFEPKATDIHVVATVVDALNCIVNLLTLHRHIFIAPLARLLPFILPFVMHMSSELRHHAAVVLASFSHTLIAHRTLVGQDTIESICFHAHSFLTPETTRHPTSSRKLPPLLDTAVSSKTFGGMGENSPWALTVVASFAILLGPSLFLHHGPLKLVMNIAQKALRHRPGRDLNSHVWRTFIWSMNQLCVRRSLASDGDIDIVRRCVLVLKQALHFGLGAALITSLLEATSTDIQNKSMRRWVISSVIDVIRDMLSSKYQEIRGEACRILECLTCEVGANDSAQRTTARTVDALLSLFLFDGSLLRADKLQVEEMAGSTPIFSPRCLSQEEILSHWRPISSCFILAVRNSLKDGDADLMTMALPVWKSLLLAQAEPIQENGPPNASTNFGLRLSSLLSDFLPEPLVSLSGDAKSIEVQLQSLVISKQLWTVARDTVSRAWLGPIAASFLAAILRRTFYLADQDVLKNWSLLCSDLIIVGIPNALESISHHDDALHALEIKRQLWRLVATHHDSSVPSNWQNLVSTLVFPFGSWSMSVDDLDLWERVFEQNFSAVGTSTKIVGVIDGIASKCPAIGPRFSIDTALRLAPIILRHLNLDEGDSISTGTLSFLSTTLTASYPPQPSTVDAAFKFIKVLHQMITSVPLSLLESVILTVQTALAVWIEDKCVSLSAEQYNDLLMPLYDSLLMRLESLPLSIPSLNACVPLLTAAFSRIPSPALGPAAFLRFFYTVHAHLAAPPSAYSDELRVCIDACVRGYGREWPPGMVPLSSSSQTQTQIPMEALSAFEPPTPLVACEDIGEQFQRVQSIEHEVIPDSQCVGSNAALGISSQARSVTGSIQRSLRSVSSILPNAPEVPSPTHFVESPRESHKSHDSTRPCNSPPPKKHYLIQGMPAAKRRRVATSTDNFLRIRSEPLARASSPVVSNPCSLPAPKSSPRNRLVMDCVEVVPLHDLLHRRGAEAQRNGRRPQRNDSEGHASDGTPERPFMPRAMRERLERDEIVPETPDALLRPARMSLLTDQESGLDNDSPTKLLSKAQPLIRQPTTPTPTHLVAALQDVHDVSSRPGLSQIPAEELADSAQLLDPANRQLRRALA